MQHHRILSRDEWLPARRRRLSREWEPTRPRDQLHAERRRNESDADFDLTDWARRPDEYEADCKGRASAA
jgi:hypothetical protein